LHESADFGDSRLHGQLRRVLHAAEDLIDGHQKGRLELGDDLRQGSRPHARRAQQIFEVSHRGQDVTQDAARLDEGC
jgi:hypothetical protein